MNSSNAPADAGFPLDASAIQQALQESLYDRGDVVPLWPEDEAAAYRDNGGWFEGTTAAEQIRFAKAAQAVAQSLQPSIAALMTSARTEALLEAAGIVRARIRDREQPFTVQTGAGPVSSGEGALWAIPDLELVEGLIRRRAEAPPQSTDPAQENMRQL